MTTIPNILPNPFLSVPKPARKPKPPKGPRNLKKHGFTNALWRLDERDKARKRKQRP